MSVAPLESLLCLWRLFSHQSSVIFPGQMYQGRSEAAPRLKRGATLHELTTRTGQKVALVYGPALDEMGRVRHDTRSRPTLLFFYGNNMCVSRSMEVFDRLRRSGCNVAIPEYVGYGLSEGRACESGCYATADAAMDFIQSSQLADRRKIFAMGASLGGAVAIDLASRRSDELAGLVTFITFSSLADVLRVHFPTVPVSRILKSRFESEAKMSRVRIPALIAHSTGDRLVPYTMADRLAAAAAGPVTRLTLQGLDHMSMQFLRQGWDEIWSVMAGFIENAVGQRSQAA